MPSARAVFRLTISSNLLGCSTGRSMGLALEDRRACDVPARAFGVPGQEGTVNLSGYRQGMTVSVSLSSLGLI
jgi:hypothetical protein